MTRWFLILTASVVMTAMAAHAATITAGTHHVNQGQTLTFEVLVAGGDAVQGLDFYLTIGNDLPNSIDPSGVPGPVVTGVDLIGSGLVFAASNNGQQAVFPTPDQSVGFAVTTNPSIAGTVPATGALARVTIDATGVAEGVYPLNLTVPDLFLPSAFIGAGSTTLVPGSIFVNVPEPATAALWCASTLLLRRPRTPRHTTRPPARD